MGEQPNNNICNNLDSNTTNNNLNYLDQVYAYELQAQYEADAASELLGNYKKKKRIEYGILIEIGLYYQVHLVLHHLLIMHNKNHVLFLNISFLLSQIYPLIIPP